jgi:hypothetical protein
MKSKYKPYYECPFCDCVMPYRDRGRHLCNPHSIDRKKKADEFMSKTEVRDVSDGQRN